MNRSTGGRVRRESTSVKDGSLLSRFSVQSSCRWESSIVVGHSELYRVVTVVNNELVTNIWSFSAFPRLFWAYLQPFSHSLF